MAETVWKLFEVIRSGCEHYPTKGTGPDTIFLVRAENPKQAAETAERELRYVLSDHEMTEATEVLELGIETTIWKSHGTDDSPMVLRGPYYNYAYCYGWKRYSRQNPDEEWKEDRNYLQEWRGMDEWFSFIAGDDDERLSRRKMVSTTLTQKTLKLLRHLELVDEGRAKKLKNTKHAGVYFTAEEARLVHQKLREEILPQIRNDNWEMIDLRKPAKKLTAQGNAELLEEEKKEMREWLEEFVKLCDECSKGVRYYGFTILRMY